MSKTTLATMVTFVRNLFLHIRRVCTRRETVHTAVAGVRTDGGKLKERFVTPDNRTREHRKAVHLVKRARRCYNNGDYVSAEGLFRSALEHDPHYALAHTYLGNAYYKQGEYSRAVTQWETAVAVDPDSEGADRARQKLARVKRAEQDVVKKLSEEVRGNR